MLKKMLICQTAFALCLISGTAYSAARLNGETVKGIVNGKTMVVTVDTSKAYQKEATSISIEKKYHEDGTVNIADDAKKALTWNVNGSGLLCEKEEAKPEECFLIYKGPKDSYFLYKRAKKGVARFGSFVVK